MVERGQAWMAEAQLPEPTRLRLRSRPVYRRTLITGASILLLGFSVTPADAEILVRVTQEVKVWEVDEIFGRPWLATDEGAFTVANPGAAQAATTSLRRLLPDPGIPSYAVEQVGNLAFVGTARGVYCLAKSSAESGAMATLIVREALPETALVSTLQHDPSGSLWIGLSRPDAGDATGGLYRVRGPIRSCNEVPLPERIEPVRQEHSVPDMQLAGEAVLTCTTHSLTIASSLSETREILVWPPDRRPGTCRIMVEARGAWVIPRPLGGIGSAYWVDTAGDVQEWTARPVATWPEEDNIYAVRTVGNQVWVGTKQGLREGWGAAIVSVSDWRKELGSLPQEAANDILVTETEIWVAGSDTAHVFDLPGDRPFRKLPSLGSKLDLSRIKLVGSEIWLWGSRGAFRYLRDHALCVEPAGNPSKSTPGRWDLYDPARIRKAYYHIPPTIGHLCGAPIAVVSGELFGNIDPEPGPPLTPVDRVRWDRLSDAFAPLTEKAGIVTLHVTDEWGNYGYRQIDFDSYGRPEPTAFGPLIGWIKLIAGIELLLVFSLSTLALLSRFPAARSVFLLLFDLQKIPGSLERRLLVRPSVRWNFLAAYRAMRLETVNAGLVGSTTVANRDWTNLISELGKSDTRPILIEPRQEEKAVVLRQVEREILLRDSSSHRSFWVPVWVALADVIGHLRTAIVQTGGLTQRVAETILREQDCILLIDVDAERAYTAAGAVLDVINKARTDHRLAFVLVTCGGAFNWGESVRRFEVGER